MGSILILVLILFFFFIYGIYDCYTYTQIGGKGVTVEAIVTSHYKSTDPEDGTEYHSYITYTYEGKEYKKLYQTKYSESNLTPIGETVYLEITPHDPENTPDGIKSTGQLGMGLSGSLFIAGLAVILKLVYSSRVKKQTVDCVNEETVEKLLQEKIKGRKIRTAFFAIAVWLLFLRLIFPLVFENSPIFAAVAGAGFLCCFCKAVVEWVCINGSYYTVCTGKLTEKSAVKDEDDVTNFYLTFSLNEHPHNHVVKTTYENFIKSKENDKIYLVYYNYDKERKNEVLTFFIFENKIQFNF